MIFLNDSPYFLDMNLYSQKRVKKKGQSQGHRVHVEFQIRIGGGGQSTLVTFWSPFTSLHVCVCLGHSNPWLNPNPLNRRGFRS